MREPTQAQVRRELESGLPGLRPPRSAVVVGAGLAGLATAYELANRGCDVTVLEASERPGGRAYTLRHPFADGMHVEAGAMTITPHCHYVHHYARELGVEMDVADLVDSQFAYFMGGRFFGPDQESVAGSGLALTTEERDLDVAGMIKRYVTGLADELRPDLAAEEWRPTPKLLPYDERSVYDVLRERGASPAAIDLMEPLFLEMRGGDLKSASALAWLRHEASPHSLTHADPRWSKIKGGTDRLPHAFADRLRGRIHYRKPVVRVRQDDDTAEVTFLEHGRLRSITAEQVVITVPFSAIRHIDLGEARLPSDKVEVMRKLKYSSIVRVYLQVRRQFWQGRAVSYSTDLPVRWLRDATPRTEGPRKILECLLTGWRARAIGAMTAEERVDFALDQVEQVLPGAREHFEVGTSVVWDKQPYIEGSYILPEVGHEKLAPVIRRPEGRIHFAGEHAGFEPNGGSMTFALESAVRTVVELGA
ncbi:flavin monoamine oxidase family protein [Saccharothrix yanglingensis]|uniref:Amine oxidase n=1 Tax=Saccharothrix yanglingensis TaxID=659496 RepID=A0ABU0WUJ5_9PSEU|nr:NAD(P)/FAD-dependent oxidoreductase [Saccharothrix yanglingensis]MDQ2583526.1 amine oxidase [Saccharothrix yanglingensis]